MQSREPRGARTRPGTTSLLVVVLMVAACVTPPRYSPEGTVRALIAADNAGDLAGAVECYDHDAVWLTPSHARITGKDAIKERYREMFASYQPELAVEISEVHAGAKLARVRGTTSGRLRPRGAGAEVAVHDAFEALLRHGAYGWRITELSWQPMPQQAPER